MVNLDEIDLNFIADALSFYIAESKWDLGKEAEVEHRAALKELHVRILQHLDGAEAGDQQ